MSEHEYYLKLHNTVLGIYYDAVKAGVTREEIVSRLKRAVEESAGITFEEREELLRGSV